MQHLANSGLETFSKSVSVMSLVHVNDGLIWKLIDRDTGAYAEGALDTSRTDQVWDAIHRHSAGSVHRTAQLHSFNAKFHLYSGILVGYAWLLEYGCLRPAWITGRGGPGMGPNRVNVPIQAACVHGMKSLAGNKRKQVCCCNIDLHFDDGASPITGIRCPSAGSCSCDIKVPAARPFSMHEEPSTRCILSSR